MSAPIKLAPGEVARFDKNHKGLFDLEGQEYKQKMEELRELAREIKAHNQRESWEQRFDELYGDTDVYPNDLIPKHDVLATHHLIKDFIRSEFAEQRLEDSAEPENWGNKIGQLVAQAQQSLFERFPDDKRAITGIMVHLEYDLKMFIRNLLAEQRLMDSAEPENPDEV